MFLYIDNTEPGEILLGSQRYYKKDAENGIIFCLDKLLKKKKLKLSDIEGIAVVTGVGRFTSSRISATTANTLAYALKIPVVSVEKGENIEKAVEKIKKAKVGTYVIPKYSGEANIGKPKQKN